MKKNLILHSISSLMNIFVVASLALSTFLEPVDTAAALSNNVNEITSSSSSISTSGDFMSAFEFTPYTSPLSAPAPTVTSVSHNQGYNYQPTTITIIGSGFVATPTAQLNNIPLTNITFVDSATLTAIVPADLPEGAYTLMVTNPDSQSASLTSAFTVLISGDGTLGAWQTTSSMTTARGLPAAVQAGNYLYVLGGGGPDSGSGTSVEMAVINDDGSLGSWQLMSSMTKERFLFAAVQVGRYLYALGGDGDISSVERAIINADGSLGTWQAVSSMNGHVQNAVVSNGYVYTFDTGVRIQRAVINPDDSLGAWQDMTSMNLPRGYLGMVVVGRYLYTIGGNGLASVERAVINTDGSLGSWQTMASMNVARSQLAATAGGGFVYAIGGTSTGFESYNSVERAKVNLDGSLSPWEFTSSMIKGRFQLAAVQSGSQIYALGSNYPQSSSVERVEINPPSLSVFSPLAVPSDSSTNVTITGANFLPAPSLQLNSTSLTATLISATTLNTTVPSGLANGWHTATLTNGDGRTAALANAVRVDGPGPVIVGGLGFTINDGALFTNQIAVTLAIGSKSDTAQMQVSNDGGFAGALWETYTSHKTWQITQYGSYVLPRVVYVRYKDINGSVSATSQDDIILDVNAPTGAVSIMGATGLQALASTVTLKISATDDVSGVGKMMISNQTDFSGAIWEDYATSRVWTRANNTDVYVKFRDNAGNVSLIYSTSGEVIDTFNSWYGSVSITSDKNVVAVGRPHIGSDEVASYSGFSAGALTAYVPMLFKNAFGGDYDSALYIQNVDASVTANVAIKYYDSTTGALTCTDTDTIKPLASKGYWLPTLSATECLPSGLPVGWVGSAVVTSSTTAKIVANGRPHISGEVMTYDSFSSGSLTSYLPMLFNGAWGSYDSAYYIQNVSPTVTAELTIKYYDSATGALTCSDTASILPNTSTGYWLPTATCLYAASTTPALLPAGWVGGVVVTSSAAPIVTVGRPHVGSQITTYNGFAAGGLSSYVPMLFRKAYGGTYDSALYVQNVGAVDAAITIKYYDSAGALTCTDTETISPLSSKGYWLPTLSATECTGGGLPDDWVGGAVVTSSSANIVAIGRPHIGAQVTTYNGFALGSSNSYLPMLFKNIWGYNSAFYIQNTDAVGPASVMVKFYDADGNLSCVRNDSIPALSTLGYWVPSVTCE